MLLDDASHYLFCYTSKPYNSTGQHMNNYKKVLSISQIRLMQGNEVGVTSQKHFNVAHVGNSEVQCCPVHQQCIFVNVT